MLKWVNRIHLVWAFVILAAAHALLYNALGNTNWVTLALLAALVDTGVIAVIQLFSKQNANSADK